MLKLRIELDISVLIECGASATERICIEATQFNDYTTRLTELTKGGTTFEDFKPTLYGIIYNGCAMSKKTGFFEYQPMPSSRGDKFLKEFRFATYEEAKEAYIKFHGKSNYFQHSIDRQIEYEKTLKSR